MLTESDLCRLQKSELKRIMDTIEHTKKQKATDNTHCKFAYNILQYHNVSKRYPEARVVKILNGEGFVTLILDGMYVYYVYTNKIVYYIIGTDLRHVTYLRINNKNDVQACTSLCIHKEVQKQPLFYTRCVIEHTNGSYVIRSVIRGGPTGRGTAKTSLLCYAIEMNVRRGALPVNIVDDAVYSILTMYKRMEYTESVLHRLLQLLPISGAGCMTLSVSRKRRKKSIHVDIGPSYYITYNGRYAGIDSNITEAHVNWYTVTDLMRSIDTSQAYPFYRLFIDSETCKMNE